MVNTVCSLALCYCITALPHAEGAKVIEIFT